MRSVLSLESIVLYHLKPIKSSLSLSLSFSLSLSPLAQFGGRKKIKGGRGEGRKECLSFFFSSLLSSWLSCGSAPRDSLCASGSAAASAFRFSLSLFSLSLSSSFSSSSSLFFFFFFFLHSRRHPHLSHKLKFVTRPTISPLLSWSREGAFTLAILLSRVGIRPFF